MFKKATRKQSKLKLALTGPSGSGKTMSALRLAHGIGKKIAVIDTENGSASLYAEGFGFEFDVCELAPPYTVESYLTAIHAAEKEYDVIVIDSISHQWKGEGGILHKKEQLDARGGNSFQNWGKLTPEQDRFTSALLHSPAHIICTLRSKQEYSLVADSNGKNKVQKLGLAPIQRDGLEYEFTVVFDVAMNHEAEASKDRTNLFNGKLFQVTEETGRQLKAWLESGEAAPPSSVSQPSQEAPKKPSAIYPQGAAEAKQTRKVTENQLKRLFAIQRTTDWTNDDLKRELKARFGLESSKEMTMTQYEELVNAIESSGPPRIDTDEEFPA